MNDPTSSPASPPASESAEEKIARLETALAQERDGRREHELARAKQLDAAEAALAAERAAHGDTKTKAREELLEEKRAHDETAEEAEKHARAAADAKLATAEVQKEVALLSPTQPHNGVPGWDRPKAAPPGLLNDRVRKPLFDQLMHAITTGRDMERGLRSTAKEILTRTKRLHPDKMTPHETILHPLLLEAEARQWRPAAHKGHRLRAHQPSKRKG